jgi:hypothetical protein
MSLITLLVLIVVFVLVWWLLSTYVLPKVAEPGRTIIVIVFIVIVIVILLGLIGIGPGIKL